MRRAAFITLLLAACADEPPSSACEPLPTTAYLIVEGVNYYIWNMRAVPPLVVGGQAVAGVYCGTNNHVPLNQWLDLPFELDDHGGAAVHASFDSRGIKLVGVAPGMNDLRLHSDWVDARFKLRAAEIASVELRPSEVEPGFDETTPWIWAPGKHALTLPVFDNGGELLIGLQPTASFPNTVNAVMSPWGYRIDVTTPGDYSIDVTAGPLTTTLSFSVSDQADSIALNDPDLQLDLGYQPTEVCFGALDQGRRVLGLAWSFTTTAMSHTGLWPNCLSVNATAAQKGQTIDVTASAGGQTATFSLPVI